MTLERPGGRPFEMGVCSLCSAVRPISPSQRTDGKYPQAVYYFYPEDVVALRDSIIAKNEEVSELQVRFYGMKEFEMLDPDGHMLLFGQDTGEAPTPE